MNPDLTTAQSLLDAAAQALHTGDRRSARHYAEQAAALAPQTEQPWLMLAFLASPRAAQYYLERALQVNPTSQRALDAKQWLEKQSAQNAHLPDSNLPAPAAVTAPQQAGSIIHSLLRYSVWLVVLVVMLAGIATLVSSARLAESQDVALVKVVQTVVKAGATLESSPTASPTQTAAPSDTPTTAPTTTSTASPVPTQTATVLPTSTSSPTAKPTATQPPAPTPVKNTPVVNTDYSVVSGDTLSLIAQRYNVTVQSLITVNNLANPSFIQAGQVLTIPRAGMPPAAARPTAAPVPAGPSGASKEILIDISEQHLYAYQNNELVFSFVASTGIGNSTRIGTFKVLDKIPRAYSNAFNIWMPYWMGIYYSGTLENGIHGLPLLMNGVELWGNLLGKPATYGCIETRTSEAKRLYDWAEIGTLVTIRR